MAPSKEKQLTVLIAQRAAQRLSTDDQLNKIQSLLNNRDPGELPKLRAQLRSMQVCFAAVAESDQKIVMLIDDDESDDLRNEIAETQQYRDKVTAIVSQAEVYIEDTTQTTPANPNTTSTGNAGKEAKVKLPQLRLAPFDGDPLKWEEFWDTFESTVHNNTDLATIDKFKYLKEFLEGNVLLLAEGYRMTAANYYAVVDQLKQRYGDKELTIQAHFDALLSLRPGSGDIDDLQRVYDECEVHVRSLVALDMDESTFGLVFAPLIKSKVPENVRLELERRHHGGPWTLPDLRQLLHSEIHARRMSKLTLGTTHNKTCNSDQDPEHSYHGELEGYDSSASVLVANANTQSGNKPRRPCAFCAEFSHFHDQCTAYPDLKTRMVVLKDACRMCLGRSHKTAACYWAHQIRCFHCNDVGKHHRSLCPVKFGNGEPVEQSLTINAHQVAPQTYSMVSAIVESQAGRGTTVMQTALATVKGTKKSEVVRLLFDTASNRSFVRSDLLERIGAKRLGRETLAVAGLGSDRRVTNNYESAEMDLVLADGSTLALQVNGLPSISAEIQKQEIDLTKHRVLQGLTFSDPLVDKPETVQVDVLIGLDYYYGLIGIEQCRIGNLAVIDSKVGLVASGYIPSESTTSTSAATPATAMIVSATPVVAKDCNTLSSFNDVGGAKASLTSSTKHGRAVLADGADMTFATFLLWIVWFIAISLGYYVLATGISRTYNSATVSMPFPSGSGESSIVRSQSQVGLAECRSRTNVKTDMIKQTLTRIRHCFLRLPWKAKAPLLRHRLVPQDRAALRIYETEPLVPGTNGRTFWPPECRE